MAHPPGSSPLRDWQAWSLSTFCSGLVVSLGMKAHHRLPASAAVIFAALSVTGAPVLVNYAYPHHY